MEAAEVLAIVGGHVDEELLLRNEYLAAENEIMKSKIEGPVRLTDPERIRLAKVAKRLGRKAQEGVPCVVKLRWYRDLVAEKFDGFKQSATTRARGTRSCSPGASHSPEALSRVSSDSVVC